MNAELFNFFFSFSFLKKIPSLPPSQMKKKKAVFESGVLKVADGGVDGERLKRETHQGGGGTRHKPCTPGWSALQSRCTG